MSNRICDILGIEKPVIQGPMVWLTDARLAAAVSNAGASNEELGQKMGGFKNLRIGMLEGDMDKGYVSVGNGISMIHEIRSAKEVIDELTRDYQG